MIPPLVLLALLVIVSNFGCLNRYYLGNIGSTVEVQIITGTSAPKHTPSLLYMGSDGKYYLKREDVSYGSGQLFSEFLLFIRISKTSSTSVKNMLLNEGLLQANSFLLEDHYELTKSGVLNCIYSRGNQSMKNNSRFFVEDDDHDCPHADYEYYLQTLVERLPFMNIPKMDLFVHPFTIVRNPFDRLVSFFYYMQDIIPHWTASEAQDKLIIAGDFPGWMKKLHEEFGTNAMEEDDPMAVPYQYEAVHSDVNRAIELTTGDDPEVLVLMSACTHVSMLLLAKKKPQFFSVDSVEFFFESPQSTANKATSLKRSSPDFNVTEMRDLHKKFFADDWKFYAAVVEQFKRDLESSGISSLKIEKCMQILD